MRAAEQLVGFTLPGNWAVVEKRKPSKAATGGKFSVGYIVANADGRRGFLKALDYAAAFQQAAQPGQALADLLRTMTDLFIFERDICERCRRRSLSQVVHAIDSGSVQVIPGDPFSNVDYLIFDLADGDIRSYLDAEEKFDLAFAFRSLHHIAVGLGQLHRADMAHQDLKPSNVLFFQKERSSKIGDLGRAWSRELRAPHDDFLIAGDPGYAPPEFHLGSVPTDVEKRRFGCDLYLLGSLIVFFFTRVNMTALLFKQLTRGNRAPQWTGDYDSYLPYLQAAFADALQEFGEHVHGSFRGSLMEMVKQLCDPDPDRRGHPLNRGSSRFSLERYISKLNLLAFRAETQLIGGSK
jgi:eukaryotic-like serine/threonine-protein kinase